MAAAWSEDHVRRLFWRAGFGARPDEARRWADAGQEATIRHLLTGPATLVGPEPTVDGRPLDPGNEWNHDVLWWLDRMVRSERPLEEKLTLFWHDHFATADQDSPLMLRQNRVLRVYGQGSFRKLLGKITRDYAMQLFLSLADSTKDAPNENFARELMELFTLGGQGYTERDIREAARALTGYRTRWTPNGLQWIRFDKTAHDHGVKRIFGKRGRFGPDDVLDLAVRHPRHAPFLVTKLWDFFVTEPIDKPTLRALTRTYKRSGLRIRPVLTQILRHPALYARLDAPDMVKSPIVYVVGTLRATEKGITSDLGWLLDMMGQVPFRPPGVAGWDWGPAWMTSATAKARLHFANDMFGWSDDAPLRVPDGTGDPKISPDEQLDRALDALGRPWISAQTRTVLTELSAGFFADLTRSWQQGKPKLERADMLQRLLRNLLLSGPDAQLH